MKRYTLTLKCLEIDKETPYGVFNLETANEIVSQINDKISLFGNVFGEFGHDYEIFDTSLSKASHAISGIRIEDNFIVCDFTILSTYCGKILKEFIKPTENRLLALNRDRLIESILYDKNYIPLKMEDLDVNLSQIQIVPRCLVQKTENIVNVQKFFTFDFKIK